jgi:hypothetical protein
MNTVNHAWLNHRKFCVNALVHLMLLKFWANICVGNTLNSEVQNCLIHCNLSDKASRKCVLSCFETDCPHFKILNVVFPAIILHLQIFRTNLCFPNGQSIVSLINKCRITCITDGVFNNSNVSPNPV